MSIELESHVQDHARSYQLGGGSQYNVEKMYLPALPERPSALSATLLGPLVRESDPLELGIHRASISNGNAVPAYVPRDLDNALTQEIIRAEAAGGFVLVVGDSTAGKSRLAYEALMRAVPDRHLVAPYDRAELRLFLAAIATTGIPVVLWLDNIERFVGADGLTPRIMMHLRNLKIITIGSIRTEHYRRLVRADIGRPNDESRAHNDLMSSEYVLNQANVLHLARRWTADEAARARHIGDQRILDALDHADIYGISEYLAAGPMLYEEWQLAWDVGQNPRGAAIVAAAIDCYRAGIHDDLPLTLLDSIHDGYLDRAGGSLLRPESFESAVTWAARRRAGVSSLLLPGKGPNTYRAFDYLTDRLMLSAAENPIPITTWEAVRDYAKDSDLQLGEIAAAAAAQGATEIAEQIWQTQVDQGNSEAAYRLGGLYSESDRDAEAAEHYKRAFELGSQQAAVELGHLMQWTKDFEAAEVWYERAASAENPHGMYHMGIIARNKGDDEAAEEWFRRAVDRKELLASSALGDLLVASGRVEEAESALRHGMEQNDIRSAVNLGIVLANLERLSEAEQAWLHAADSEVYEADYNLALLYERQRRFVDAEKRYLAAIAGGGDVALVSYGNLLVKRGRKADARRVLLEALDKGENDAYKVLARIAADAWNHTEAVDWLEKALEKNPDDLKLIAAMADALANGGRPKDAVPYWQKLVDFGDTDATYPLGRIKHASGELEAARSLFHAGAKSGDAVSACRLGHVYYDLGDIPRYEEWLLVSAARGHAHAACLLGSFYNRRAEIEKAEHFWRRGYDGGHKHLASDLSSLFASQGRGRDAAVWLKRSRSVPHNASGPARGPGRRRRRQS